MFIHSFYLPTNSLLNFPISHFMVKEITTYWFPTPQNHALKNNNKGGQLHFIPSPSICFVSRCWGLIFIRLYYTKIGWSSLTIFQSVTEKTCVIRFKPNLENSIVFQNWTLSLLRTFAKTEPNSGPHNLRLWIFFRNRLYSCHEKVYKREKRLESTYMCLVDGAKKIEAVS